MNASFESALAKQSSLWIKMPAHVSMQTQTYTISGIEFSRTDNTVLLSTGSGCIDLKRPTETLRQTERRGRKLVV